MSRDRPVHAVLFDLDGTLVDSALDLGGAGNDLRERRGLPPLPLEVFRPLTGTGARGMLRVALGTTPEDADFEALKDEYLAIYATRLTRLTRVFDAMAPVLDALDAAALPWGIVTNKHSRFAEPVEVADAALYLASDASGMVNGALQGAAQSQQGEAPPVGRQLPPSELVGPAKVLHGDMLIVGGRRVRLAGLFPASSVRT